MAPAPFPREQRRLAFADALTLALEAATACGVTRLADLTYLDRFGLPVFQAVRPLGRALSVHQGKGADRDRAKISALMEAVESWHAETFVHVDVRCRFDELTPTERADVFTDFCVRTPDEADLVREYDWVRAERIGSAGALYVPMLCVSLDFTHSLDTPLDRSSNGLAAGGSEDEATLTGLFEQVERDAVGAWRRARFVDRSRTWCNPPLPWLVEAVSKLRAAGLASSLFRVPSIAEVPVFVFQLADLSPDGYGVWGSGCHNDAEIAIFKAFSEALQSRLTMIAGARDDLLRNDYRQFRGLGFGIAPPQGDGGAAWAMSGGGLGAGTEIAELAARLAAQDFPDTCRVVLTNPAIGVPVVKVFTPGLGNGERPRRSEFGTPEWQVA